MRLFSLSRAARRPIVAGHPSPKLGRLEEIMIYVDKRPHLDADTLFAGIDYAGLAKQMDDDFMDRPMGEVFLSGHWPAYFGTLLDGMRGKRAFGMAEGRLKEQLSPGECLLNCLEEMRRLDLEISPTAHNMLLMGLQDLDRTALLPEQPHGKLSDAKGPFAIQDKNPKPERNSNGFADGLESAVNIGAIDHDMTQPEVLFSRTKWLRIQHVLLNDRQKLKRIAYEVLAGVFGWSIAGLIYVEADATPRWFHYGAGAALSVLGSVGLVGAAHHLYRLGQGRG